MRVGEKYIYSDKGLAGYGWVAIVKKYGGYDENKRDFWIFETYDSRNGLSSEYSMYASDVIKTCWRLHEGR